MQQGGAGQLRTPGAAGQHAQTQCVRSAFLHGPGGSGKTYCMTEVVLKVVRHFLGDTSVKAIAAHNSAARLLLGKTHMVMDMTPSRISMQMGHTNRC